MLFLFSNVSIIIIFILLESDINLIDDFLLHEIIFFSLFFLKNFKNRQIDGVAPTFLKKPSIRQEDDGKRLFFECLIKADPVPQVRWSHNGAPVDDAPGSRFKVFSALFPNG